MTASSKRERLKRESVAPLVIEPEASITPVPRRLSSVPAMQPITLDTSAVDPEFTELEEAFFKAGQDETFATDDGG